MELRKVVDLLRQRVEKAGGVVPFVKQANDKGFNVSRLTVYRVLEGYNGPGPELLACLGLQKVVVYEEDQKP